MKLKIGDEIFVTVGKDKGKKGKIEKIFPKQSGVLIPNINVYKKFRKNQTDNRGKTGGIIEFNRPLPVSNVLLVCPNCHKPTRIGYLIKNHQKLRFCKKCKTSLE